VSGDLKGQVVVITAAAQGIGRATAETFDRLGAQVWATDINEAGLTEVEGGPQLHRRKLNVLDAATRLLCGIGRVDVLPEAVICSASAPAVHSHP
jgi:2-keto-3-deoxy-L-fuconate dehydrogenase